MPMEADRKGVERATTLLVGAFREHFPERCAGLTDAQVIAEFRLEDQLARLTAYFTALQSSREQLEKLLLNID